MTTNTSRKYHTLLSRDAKGDPWCIFFGDYDREVVETERDDCRGDYHAMRIIVTSDQQADIEDAVHRLNEEIGS